MSYGSQRDEAYSQYLNSEMVSIYIFYGEHLYPGKVFKSLLIEKMKLQLGI